MIFAQNKDNQSPFAPFSKGEFVLTIISVSEIHPSPSLRRGDGAEVIKKDFLLAVF